MSHEELAYEQFISDFNRYISVVQSRSFDKYPNKQKELADLRKIPIEVIQESGIFYVGDSVELALPTYLTKLKDFGIISPTNNMIVYHDRWVFPIKDMKGNIIGHVGYTPDANERYVYGTSLYYNRLHDLYGLEQYPLALEKGWAIVTEGITDCLAFRGLGYKNTFAMCGVRKSSYKELILNRLPYGILKVPDNDKAGKRTIPLWDFKRSFLIKTPFGFKDTAQVLESEEWRKHYEACFPQIIDELIKTYGNGMHYKDYPVLL